MPKKTFRGQDRSYKLMDAKLDKSKTVKDLGISVAEDLTWKAHIYERLRKANKVLHLIRKNVAVNVKAFIKLGLYKSLTLPILLFGFSCVSASRAELQFFERFQKKVVRWITCIKGSCYGNQLRILNILPLPMFIQMSGILLLAKVMTEDDEIISLPERQDPQKRITEVFKQYKTRTKKARGEFVFRTCRLVNQSRKTSKSVNLSD